MTQTQSTPRRQSAGLAERRRDARSTAVRLTLNGLYRIAPAAAARLAFELWRRPGPLGAVRPAEREVHEAAQVSAVEHQGRRATTYAWGDGQRPVLLVHGWNSRASRFADLVKALLDRGYSPVSYDAFGHGGTGGGAGTILDNQAVIKALANRHGPFEGVIAHSLGVPFALYAVREGVPVHRVVAISGVSDFGYLVDTFCTKLGLHPSLNQRLRRRIERSLFDGDAGIWDRFSAGTSAGCDLLIVHDAVDYTVDRGQAGLLAAGYGDRATLIETTGLGHSRILHDPTVIEAAVAFLGAEAAAA
jgi:pimeloyl-ACP methyl ester carboxylesterase